MTKILTGSLKAFNFSTINFRKKLLTEFFIYAHFSSISLTNNDNFIPIKFYSNAETQKSEILKDQKGKSGVYRWVHKENGHFYIGRSVNLGNRLNRYFSPAYLKSNNMIICLALLKYGHSSFSLEILEYCNIKDLVEKEQYYFNLFNPKYNMLTDAGSSLGFKHSEESKKKISEAISTTIYQYSLDQKLLGTFSSSILAAKHFNCSSETIMANARSYNIFKNKFILSLEPIDSNFQLTQPFIKGTTIFLYTSDYQLIQTFTSSRMAAKHFNCDHNQILRYSKSNKIFKDEFILSLAPLESNYQPTKDTDFRGQKASILIYSLDHSLLQTFSTAKEAAKHFNCMYTTILRYARAGAIFQDKFILSLEPIQSGFQPARISNSLGIFIYLYNLNGELLETFTSASAAAKYLKSSFKTILIYARSRTVFKDKYLLSLEKILLK